MRPKSARRAQTWLLFLAAATSCSALAVEEWQVAYVPPPNAGRVAYVILGDGNPACASYDGANCLWGKTRAEIDFAKVKPLVCGARHRQLYGSTGFEDPKHWCNLALRLAAAQTTPAIPAPPATPAPSTTPEPPRPTPAPSPATPAPPAPAPATGVRVSEWSPWARAADVEYRYRIRWDPATGGAGKTVEAIYEIRNRGSKTWAGVARSLDCAQGTLWGSTDVSVGAQQLREAHVRAPNCGTAKNPDIRPNLVRQGKFD